MNNNVIGFDVGTGNLVGAKYKDDAETIEISKMRNVFYLIDPELFKSTMMVDNKLSFIEILNDEDEIEKVAIIGQDAYDWCNAFDASVRRPMQKGVITTKDIDALEVVTLMVERLVGRSNGGFCVYSIPAQSIDVDIPPVLYHEKVFGKIFESLGYKSEPMNEGMSIIFSECAKENFTGISLSFGAGLTNVACSFKGVPALTFSVSRGGDWIDESVADSLGLIPNRITKVKEKDTFDLMNPKEGRKSEKRIREAIAVYYENLINYVLRNFVNEIEKKSEGIDLETEMPIVVSGGTSMAGNFLEMFKNVFSKLSDNFPFDISEIRAASDPLCAVANGNLIYASWKNKKNLGENKDEERSKTSKK